MDKKLNERANHFLEDNYYGGMTKKDSGQDFKQDEDDDMAMRIAKEALLSQLPDAETIYKMVLASDDTLQDPELAGFVKDAYNDILKQIKNMEWSQD